MRLHFEDRDAAILWLADCQAMPRDVAERQWPGLLAMQAVSEDEGGAWINRDMALAVAALMPLDPPPDVAQGNAAHRRISHPTF